MTKTRKPRKKIILKIFACITVLILIFITVNTISNKFVFVSNYTVESDKINNSMRIVMISDFHHNNFGENNTGLVNKIKEQNPDIITVLGDMINGDINDFTNEINLIEQLCEIAPTYHSMGNHEFDSIYFQEYKQQVRNTGAVLLDDEIINTDIKGNKILIMGLSYYIFKKDETLDKYTALMNQFCSSDNYKILLCHYPEYTKWFFKKDLYCTYNFDLMLSGHTHGGIVRLPFIGGLYSPNQGLFPEYDKGLYEITSGANPYTMIITSGCSGNTKGIPRINNPNEITVVDIK